LLEESPTKCPGHIPKINDMNKNIIKNAIGFFILIMVLFVMHGTFVNQMYQGRAWSIEQLISDFIRENGRFPDSEQELVDKGYIRIEFENGVPTCYVRTACDQKNKWEKWPVYLERFEILYGVKIDDFIVKDKKLYKRGTNEQIFLLSGPYNRKMEPTLRRMYNYDLIEMV